jgi:RHS repeat-associated protein
LLHAETGFSYFGARYYDSDILTDWLSVDPLADKYPGLSPYAYCALNPIRVVDPNGDSIIINKFGYVIRNDNTDNKVFLKENNRITNLGELGGKIDVNYIYSNLLKKNAKEAKSIWNPFKFRELVKTNGDWDLKNDKESIYGMGNDGITTFLYKGAEMEAQDLGNHHFGYVAKAYGLFPEDFILRQAGNYQIKSGTSMPEWQMYEDVNKISKPDPMCVTPIVPKLLPPYGDDPRDQMWIRKGIYDYKNK